MASLTLNLRPVIAYQTDTVAGIDKEGDAVEKEFPVELNGDVIE